MFSNQNFRTFVEVEDPRISPYIARSYEPGGLLGEFLEQIKPPYYSQQNGGKKILKLTLERVLGSVQGFYSESPCQDQKKNLDNRMLINKLNGAADGGVDNLAFPPIYVYKKRKAVTLPDDNELVSITTEVVH